MNKKFVYLGFLIVIGIFIVLSYPVFHFSLRTSFTLFYLFIISTFVVNSVISFRKKQTVVALTYLVPIFLSLCFMIRLYM